MANIRVGRRSGLVLRGGRDRRDTLWAATTETRNVLAAANSQAVTTSGSPALLELTPFTIIRSRMVFFSKSDQTVGLEDWEVAYGETVVSVPASLIGITAVPTPFTDLGSDLWFVHAINAGSFIFVSGVGFHPTGGVVTRIDSKAMRKVEDGETVIGVLENPSLSLGTSSLVVGRFLIKLH